MNITLGSRATPQGLVVTATMPALTLEQMVVAMVWAREKARAQEKAQARANRSLGRHRAVAAGSGPPAGRRTEDVPVGDLAAVPANSGRSLRLRNQIRPEGSLPARHKRPGTGARTLRKTAGKRSL